MMKLTLAKFDFESDEKGYICERNCTGVLEFVVDPEAGTPWRESLMEVLRIAIGPPDSR